MHAFLWTDGVMQDLGTLGGWVSEARGINDSGQVVGEAYKAGGPWHAFRWTDGDMLDEGTLPGGVSSSAQESNDAGQVGGRCYREPASVGEGIEDSATGGQFPDSAAVVAVVEEQAGRVAVIRPNEETQAVLADGQLLGCGLADQRLGVAQLLGGSLDAAAILDQSLVVDGCGPEGPGVPFSNAANAIGVAHKLALKSLQDDHGPQLLSHQSGDALRLAGMKSPTVRAGVKQTGGS